MRTFTLVRDVDVTGVSGTGTVAEGVEFTDGTVVLRWISAFPTSVVFHDRGMESVEAVHGHNGATRVVWETGKVKTVYRSSVTGGFVTENYAKTHPRTTYQDTVPED